MSECLGNAFKTMIFEEFFSVAILRYLCRERDVPAHWYPKDSKQQAKIDEYLEWHHLDTRLNCFTFFQIKVGISNKCFK
jgi:glutathione S-transferase